LSYVTIFENLTMRRDIAVALLNDQTPNENATMVCSCSQPKFHSLNAFQLSWRQLQHLKRTNARKLLTLARASREAARADAISARSRLDELRKAVEVFRVQEIIALAKLSDADQQIGAICGALDIMGIPEVSLSDGEDDIDESTSCEPPALKMHPEPVTSSI
jgi:hypothetical protein